MSGTMSGCGNQEDQKLFNAEYAGDAEQGTGIIGF